MPINLLDLNVDVLGHIVFQLDSADACGSLAPRTTSIVLPTIMHYNM